MLCRYIQSGFHGVVTTYEGYIIIDSQIIIFYFIEVKMYNLY